MMRTIIVAVSCAFLAGFAAGYVVRTPPHPADVAAAHVATKRAQRIADSVVRRADSARDTYAAWRDRYIKVRTVDTVRKDSVVYVPRALADSVVAHCDTAIEADTAVIAAKDTAIAAQSRELHVVRSLIAPRVQFTVDGLYDWLHRTPTVRASVQLHLRGPLSLVTTADIAAMRGDSITTRLYAGVRYAFR